MFYDYFCIKNICKIKSKKTNSKNNIKMSTRHRHQNKKKFLSKVRNFALKIRITDPTVMDGMPNVNQ